jgi:hypothetical protein
MRPLHLKVRSLAWLSLIEAALLASLTSVAWPAQGPADAPESLDRPGNPRLEGRLVRDLSSGLSFLPRGESSRAVALPPGSVVEFRGPGPSASAIPPLFQMRVGETARISGTLRAVGGKALVLGVPWQGGEVTIARPGVQALLQRPGEAGLFAEGFETLDRSRWSPEGSVELAADSKEAARRVLTLGSEGASVRHRLAEPLGSGRLEMAFRDDGQVVPGRRCALELTFRGTGGPSLLRVLLGWAEESLAVESPDGPSLAVQRLARTAGWHRLTLRFGPEQTEVSVDGKELAHGRGPSGPLQEMGLATGPTAVGAAAPPPGLAARVGEIQVVRFAEPPASLEIDPSQDEARLVTGDQLFGRILEADPRRVLIEVTGQPVSLPWSEVSGLHFRREPAAARSLQGAWVRAEWRASPGEPLRELDFAEGVVTALSPGQLTLDTPYCGSLSVPLTWLTRLKVLEAGWRQVLDPAAHHLGDEIKAMPVALDPPVPEGGSLERSFTLERLEPTPLFLSLDVRDVVGETGSPYSNLVQKGEIRTFVALNGKRIDTLNRHISTANETPERIRILLPAESLKAGKNLVRIEQTGTASDPTAFDDLEVLQVAIERPAGSGAPAGTRIPSAPQP